jgi:threonine/homoserine/homoserine lactone efflux protein
MEVFLKGLIAGFIIAVPLGPVSVLCFRRVLTGPRPIGLCTVFGAAAADTIYGLIAATGISAITHTILIHREPLRIFGGLFLLYLGYSMCRADPAAAPAEERSLAGLPAAFFSAFGLMIANPTIIISFLAVFAAIDLGAHRPGVAEASWLGAGVFLGSAAWWLVYELAVALFGERLRRDGLRAIDVAAGLLICGFGLWQIAEALLRR